MQKLLHLLNLAFSCGTEQTTTPQQLGVGSWMFLSKTHETSLFQNGLFNTCTHISEKNNNNEKEIIQNTSIKNNNNINNNKKLSDSNQNKSEPEKKSLLVHTANQNNSNNCRSLTGTLIPMCTDLLCKVNSSQNTKIPFSSCRLLSQLRLFF